MENPVKKNICAPPITMCCEEFTANFGPRNKRFHQDSESGFVKERGGRKSLLKCPFCGAEIDPVVYCRICRCLLLFSQAWVDNGRYPYLCSKHGKELLHERITRTDLGDAA